MDLGIYNEMVIYARRLLFCNNALGMSFNEYDLVNDVYLDYPHLINKVKFRNIIIKKLNREKTISNILTGRDFTKKLIEETRVCTKCREDLPVMLFGKDRGMCGKCRTKRAKELREEKKKLEPINKWLDMLNSYKI